MPVDILRLWQNFAEAVQTSHRTYHLEGKRFIEVGCGQGEFLQVLKEFPVEVHGIEHDPALVELAKARALM